MKKPGQTRDGLVHSFAETVDTRDHLIFDFDVDDPALKAKHVAFLQETLTFMASNLAARRAQGSRPAWKVSLDGYASRTGTREHNLVLSAQRERAVQDFLTTRIQRQHRQLFDEVTFDPHFHGFDETPTAGDARQRGEDPVRRSVRIVVHPPARRPAPRPLPDLELGSTRFRIQLLGLISAGFIASHDDAFFQITDLEKKRAGVFQFVAAGLAAPVPKLPFISATLSGPPQDFRTSRPVQLFEFVGKASFGQPPAVGPFSSPSLLHIENDAFLKKGVFTIPTIIPVPTGFTAGVTIFSSTTGVLALHLEGPVT